ncbi:MAG: glycosyltransferase [Nitrososphaerales archaeon]
MPLEHPTLTTSNKTFSTLRCGQQIAKSGRIKVSKKAWSVRFVALLGASFFVAYNILLGLEVKDPFVIYSTLLPLHSVAYLVVGWLFYRNPATGKVGNDLVSVIIPVYNQKTVIEDVIDAVYNSTYKNIEVIAVNDGSKDGTREVLDSIAKKHRGLKVIHKHNEGKRKAVATGFYESKANFVVLIDSDSIIDKHAITELMKAFYADPTIGATVAYAKVANVNKNIITKCQDAWYDYSFNIRKAAESSFGNVLCCSGCMAAYRREAIAHYIPYWIRSRLPNSDDRELTTSVILPPFTKKLLEAMAAYDDAEDRGLTGQALVEWKAVYVPTAVVYTEVPYTMKIFLRQQKRWKKGTTRVNFFMSAFFWRKHPVMSLIFYIDFMMTFTTPFIVAIIFVYNPFILQNAWLSTSFIAGMVFLSIVHGLDYKFRDPISTNWKYKPLMNLITAFKLSWLIFHAIWSYRKNEWGTR